MVSAVQTARMGLIGDVHTEHEALALAIAHLRTQGVDQLFCTGDLVDGPELETGVDACVALLREHAVHTILGNHERWVQDDAMRDLPQASRLDELSTDTRAYLAKLPPTIEIDTPVGLGLFCHGLGADDMGAVQPHDHAHALTENESLQTLIRGAHHRFVVNGHTHRRMVRTIDQLTIINAGTLLRGQLPCCSVVDFVKREVQYFDLEATQRFVALRGPLGF
jgi:predicted phosphodiesterase